MGSDVRIYLGPDTYTEVVQNINIVCPDSDEYPLRVFYETVRRNISGKFCYLATDGADFNYPGNGKILYYTLGSVVRVRQYLEDLCFVMLQRQVTPATDTIVFFCRITPETITPAIHDLLTRIYYQGRGAGVYMVLVHSPSVHVPPSTENTEIVVEKLNTETLTLRDVERNVSVMPFEKGEWSLTDHILDYLCADNNATDSVRIYLGEGEENSVELKQGLHLVGTNVDRYPMNVFSHTFHINKSGRFCYLSFEDVKFNAKYKGDGKVFMFTTGKQKRARKYLKQLREHLAGRLENHVSGEPIVIFFNITEDTTITKDMKSFIKDMYRLGDAANIFLVISHPWKVRMKVCMDDKMSGKYVAGELVEVVCTSEKL